MALCNLVLQFVGIYFAHLPYEEILVISCNLKMKVQSMRFHEGQRQVCKVEKKVQGSCVLCSVSHLAATTLGDVCFLRWITSRLLMWLELLLL